MMSAEEILKIDLDKMGLVPGRDRVGVAVSGGADSTALLIALVRLGVDCEVLHCDFHLRGGESVRDERFVRDLCTSMGVPFHLYEPDVAGYMKQSGCSLEMACRDLRYEWFRAMAEEHGYKAVAVAHHSDDNIETLFLNLLRGTGITGLRGMRPVNGLIVRPMLGCSRSDAEAYLRSIGESWVNDSTNAENDFRRNRIRNVILPAIRNQIPESAAGIRVSMGALAEESRFLDYTFARKRDIYVDPATGSVDIAGIIASEGEFAPLVLWHILRDNGVTRTMAEDIVAATGRSGRIFGNYELHGRMLLPLSGKDGQAKTLVSLSDGPWIMKKIACSEFKPLRDPGKVWFDISVLDNDPQFRLEPWREGMRIAPFGMRSGTRKLSDVFSDRHYSLSQKRTVKVLTRNGTVIWVPGVIASRHFPVTDSTSEIVMLDAGVADNGVMC